MRQRRWAVIVMGVVVMTASACARGQRPDEWPTRPVRMIVPYPAGSGPDLAARLFAPLLSQRWQRPVVVDNRPGGDGVVGVRTFVSADDGHTLLFTTIGPVTVSPLLHARLPYDPIRDLVPISSAGRVTIGVAASKTCQATSLSDLADLARRHPGRYLWTASQGLPELVFRAFLELEDLEMKHVAYRDTSLAVHDLDAGRIHAMVAAVPTLAPSLQAGARLLAVTNTERVSAMPDVATVAEAGYPGMTVDGGWGFFGWREMPAALRDRIAADIRHAARDPALVSRLKSVGLAVDSGTAEDFARSMERQRLQVREIARIVGLPAPAASGGQ